MATEAFAAENIQFSPERIKWLYERSFGSGTTVLAAVDDGRKVGQIAMIGQTVCVNGELAPRDPHVLQLARRVHRRDGLHDHLELPLLRVAVRAEAGRR